MSESRTVSSPSNGMLVAVLFLATSVFAGWAWGGVVLWTQWVVAGLGLFTLAVALLPGLRSGEAHGCFLPRVLGASLGLGALVAATLLWVDLDLVLTQRDAALQMLPGANLPEIRFAEWGLRGLLAGTFTTLASLIIGSLLRPSESRRRLFRLLPFWLGLFLFAWIACQSWNTWGVVVQRDLFWRILPREHITWLPSGLDAPFFSDEEPGGMNGWRQLLIWVGPWALLCGLVSASLSRKSLAIITSVVCANGLVVGLVGYIYRQNKWKEFLGVSDPDLRTGVFGPFIYKNHAGVYLYLLAGLAGALAFYLVRRRGDQADKGGLYLIAALLMVFLALVSVSTLSLGSMIAAALLVFVACPVAFVSDARIRECLSPLPLLASLVLLASVIFVAADTGGNKAWLGRMEVKLDTFFADGEDDRAPLRRATWDMITSAEGSRLIFGWGSGSYRWISPGYLRQQPEFLNKRGELRNRATHAHNDWLQLISDLGLAGWIGALSLLIFVSQHIRSAIIAPSAIKSILVVSLLLLGLQAFFDFLMFMPIMIVAALTIGWLESSDSSRALSHRR